MIDQILQVGLLVVLFQVRDSTSNQIWYIFYYELVREVEISYVCGYMYVEKCMMSCGIQMHLVE